MDKIKIKGGKELKGKVEVSAAKNAVLPIIAASILSDGVITINNLPLLRDVYVICELLNTLGCEVLIDNNLKSLNINSNNIRSTNAYNELTTKMRASFLIMGPMLAKYGKCKISLPGGCNIGSRPVDLHLKGLKALGINYEINHGYIEASAKKILGNRIYLDFPSVGATENIIMCASLAKGTTIIENAANEPEIQDLTNFLNSIGAKIQYGSNGKIIIDGVTELKGGAYRPIGDRIEAGTYMVAAALTNSIIEILGVNEEHLSPVIEKLRESGTVFDIKKDRIIVNGKTKKKPFNIKTMPYPGFPTDMQAQIMALSILTEGVSVITETVFENRFMHVDEFIRMGANIKVDQRTALVQGVKRITGCEVKATDLRAGAAMILAGLVAEGETDIVDIYHIDRGYANIEAKLQELGACIERV